MARLIDKGSKEYNCALIMMFFGSVAAFGAEYCLQPVIPILAQDFNLTPTVASLSMSLGTIGMALSMLLIASVSKYLDRKKVMVVALGISAILIVLMSFMQDFAILLALRFVQGVLLAGFPSLAVAYINEEFNPRILGTAIGVYVAATPLGGLTGRILISTLTDVASWRLGLMVAGVLYLASAILMWIFLPPSLNKQIEHGKIHIAWQDFFSLLKSKKIIMIYIVTFCVMGCFVCSYNFISYVLMEAPYNLSQTVIGFVFVLYLIGSLSSAIMGSLSDRYGHGIMIVISIVIQLVGILITLFMPLFVKIIGLAVFTYGFFGAHSNACAWAPQSSHNDKAQVSALYMLFYYVGASVVGTAGGSFLSNFGWAGVVSFESVILLVGLCVSIILLWGERREKRKVNIQKN